MLCLMTDLVRYLGFDNLPPILRSMFQFYPQSPFFIDPGWVFPGMLIVTVILASKITFKSVNLSLVLLPG